MAHYDVVRSHQVAGILTSGSKGQSCPLQNKMSSNVTGGNARRLIPAGKKPSN
jgi:hypothetical protein